MAIPRSRVVRREERESVDSEKNAANGCVASAPTSTIRSTLVRSSEEQESPEKEAEKGEADLVSVRNVRITFASSVGKREDHPDNRFCRREVVAQLNPEPQAASRLSFAIRAVAAAGRTVRKRLRWLPRKATPSIPFLTVARISATKRWFTPRRRERARITAW